MTQQEEFEFRYRLEKEKEQTDSAPQQDAPSQPQEAPTRNKNESIPSILGRNAVNAIKETGGIVTNAINDLSFNNIKPNVARKFGEETANNIFPPTKGVMANTTRFALGAAAPGGALLKSMGLVKGGAAIGAASGAINDIASPDTTLEQRGAGAAVGGAMGLAIGGAAKGAISLAPKVNEIWKNIKQAVDMDARLPKAKTLIESVDRLSTQKENLNTASQLLANTNSLKTRDIQGTIKKISSSVKEDVKNISYAIGQQSKDLASTLKSEIGKKVSSTQDAVPEFFRNAGTAYGETQEHIISMFDSPIIPEGLLKKGALPINKQEVFDKLNNILAKGKGDPLIENSLPYKKVQLLVEKYNPDAVSPSKMIYPNGSPIVKNIGEESVNLKELLAEMRDMRASVSSGVRGGSKAISPEDITASRFQFEISETLKDRIPAFRELQESYRPVMQAKELAYTTFKPSKGTFATTTAEAFFKRIAFKDKISGQDQALLDMLENGTTVAGKPGGINVSGIGDISSELKSIGKKLSSLSEEKVSKQLAIQNGSSLNINGLQAQVRLLQDNKNLFNIEKIKRIDTLDNRLKIINKALDERNKIQTLKKQVGLGAAGLVGAGILGKMGIKALVE